MKLKKKSKAFTLTELLVVVVVIGVLSAVVLPKYSKVIETRRTTEAEELMGAIRTEQEKRCALDKEYLMKFDGLKDIVTNPDTKNYKLALASKGISAKRKDGKYNYTLQMPSYADGRICCDDEACKNLNKNYPTCNELKGKGDYQDSPASCAGKIKPPTPPTPPTPCEIDPTSCECNPNQAKCCPEGTVWENGACVTPEPEPEPCNDCSCPEYAAAHQTECNPAPEPECNDCSCAEYAASHAAECQDKDCCADDFTGNFAECIKQKYGYNSAEYICASGAPGFVSGIGSVYGVYSCGVALNIGSDYSSLEKYGDVWLNGGFKRYACDGKPSYSSSGTSSDENDTTPGTCTISQVGSGSCRNQALSCDGFNFASTGASCKNSNGNTVWGGKWSGTVECADPSYTKEKTTCASVNYCFGGSVPPGEERLWSSNTSDCPGVQYTIYECK